MIEIKNTIIKELNINGKLMAYEIYPKEGYKLHEKSRDKAVFDENGNETGEIKPGYTQGVVTVRTNYNFELNPREIYAVESRQEGKE